MDRFKKLGCSIGFDDNLGRADEKARFGENIGVQESVSDGVEGFLQGFKMGGFVVVCI